MGREPETGAGDAAGRDGAIAASAGATDGAGAGRAAGAPVMAGGVEHLGVVAGESEKRRLIAEAEAALPADVTAAPGAAQQAESAGSWADITPPVVAVTCGIVLPQWDIKANEQKEVATALAQCMDQVFPGGLDGKYACWVRLIMACGAITISRATQPAGLPPLFNNRRDEPRGGAAVDPLSVTSLT